MGRVSAFWETSLTWSNSAKQELPKSKEVKIITKHLKIKMKNLM